MNIHIIAANINQATNGDSIKSINRWLNASQNQGNLADTIYNESPGYETDYIKLCNIGNRAAPYLYCIVKCKIILLRLSAN